MAGVRTGVAVYSSLLKTYCKTNRTREVTSLLRDALKAGIQLDSSCYEALIQSQIIPGVLHVFKVMKEANIPRGGNQQFETLLKGCEGNAEAGLMSKLLREIKEGQSLNAGVHDWNNVIHFFSKKGLTPGLIASLHDARWKEVLDIRQMLKLFIPWSLDMQSYGVNTPRSLSYGEMKSIAAATSLMRFDQELLDSVLNPVL